MTANGRATLGAAARCQLQRAHQGQHRIGAAELHQGWLPRLMPANLHKRLDEMLPAWLAALEQKAERALSGQV
jgi:hypothetical protein